MGPRHPKEHRSDIPESPGTFIESMECDNSWLNQIERSFVVVWCDATIGLTPNAHDDTNTLMQLARIVNKKRQLIHTFNDIAQCQDFIQHVNNICLIVSGSMGYELIPLVHDLGQIHSIYIFCLNKPKYDLLAKQFPKVCGVFTNIQEICQRLQTHFISQSASDYDQVQFDLLSKDLPISTTDKRELIFLYPLFAKMILSKLKSIKSEQMIDYCRQEYSSTYQLHLIDEFEMKYNQHDPIWWFTRDSFFQGIINRALQVHDLYTLCMMNPFLRDLDWKLSELQRQQSPATQRRLVLYVSQSIPIDDLKRLRFNTGGLVCINQFLLANTERSIALMFIEHQKTTTTDSNNINGLFEITVPQSNLSNVSFANIGAVSEFVHEKEYLLSMSSIHRIDRIEECPDIQSTWSVHLTLMDKNHSQLSRFTTLLHQEFLDADQDLAELGSNIITKFSQFKATTKLYEQQMNFKSKQIRPILLRYNLGIIYDCLDKYDKAVEEYKYAINLTRASIPNGLQEDRICLVPLYSNIALTYQQLSQNKHAFDHAYRTLNILSRDGANSFFRKELLASSHFNLGFILDQQGKHAEAKNHYEQALRKRMDYLPPNHPDIKSVQDIIASSS